MHHIKLNMDEEKFKEFDWEKRADRIKLYKLDENLPIDKVNSWKTIKVPAMIAAFQNLLCQHMSGGTS